MQLRVNGEIQEFESEISLSDLVRFYEITAPHFAVAVNRSIIPRSEHLKMILKEGDEVELVHPIGGG